MQRPVTEPASAAAGHVVECVKPSEPFLRQGDRRRRMGGIGCVTGERRDAGAQLPRRRGQRFGLASRDHHSGPGGETGSGAGKAEPRAAADDDDDAIGEGGEGHRANELTREAAWATVNRGSEKDPRGA